MSDTSLNRFLGQGDDAVQAAFTPDPPTVASGPDPLTLFLNTESTAVLRYWDGAAFQDVPASSDIQALLDGISTTQGVILYYNGTNWVALSPGSSGEFLQTQGAGANPQWAAASGGSGKIAQVVSANFTSSTTGTTQIPGDDTIPQNTEGDEYMTLAITPTNAASTLVIQANLLGASGTTSRYLSVALFQDSTANALAATTAIISTANGTVAVPLTYTMTAGTTSATTFKVRAGLNSTGTVTFNGVAGTRLFGAITKSSMIITEVLP